MELTKQELKDWKMYYKQYKNDYHLSKHDWSEFVRLNHILMELSHDIHNHNMIKE